MSGFLDSIKSSFSSKDDEEVLEEESQQSNIMSGVRKQILYLYCLLGWTSLDLRNACVVIVIITHDTTTT